MYCIYFSSVPIPDNFNGNPIAFNCYGYYSGEMKQKDYEIYPCGFDSKDNPYIKWYASYKRAESAAIKLSNKSAYVVDFRVLEWGDING